MMIKKNILRIIIYCTCAILAGCSNHHSYRMHLTAEKNLNLGHKDMPLPVVVKFYELTSLDNFENTNFSKLWKSDKSVLGETLVNTTEVVMQPGEHLRLDIKDIKKDSKYMVAVAMFRTPEDKKWYVISEITNSIFIHDFKVRLNHNSIKLAKK